jgi:hypothetical protein
LQQSNILLHRPTIRFITGGLLLLVFAFSITPKVVLHNVFANHKDVRYPSGEKETQVNKSGFYCDTENQVVEIPYLEHYSFVVDRIIGVTFQAFQSRKGHQFLSFTCFITGLRGPPSSL